MRPLLLAAVSNGLLAFNALAGTCPVELTPMRPIVPAGYRDLVRTCICDAHNGGCRWAWVGVRNNGGMDPAALLGAFRDDKAPEPYEMQNQRNNARLLELKVKAAEQEAADNKARRAAMSQAAAAEKQTPAALTESSPAEATGKVATPSLAQSTPSWKSAPDLIKDAESGDAGAQVELGDRYNFGLGVSQDHREAAKWFRQAAEHGNARAQSSLGLYYYLGQGEKPDYPAALRWFRKAAEQESAEREVAEAQAMLGEMFYSGEGTPQDYSEAFRWSRKAANRGIAGAQTWLATMYFRGHGVPKDASEAVHWYRKAAEQGTDQAQAMLGVLYSQGQGVLQDYVLAHMWLNLAASQGGENQKDRAAARDQVAQKMTREQLAEAQRMAREWRPLKVRVPQ